MNRPFQTFPSFHFHLSISIFHLHSCRRYHHHPHHSRHHHHHHHHHHSSLFPILVLVSPARGQPAPLTPETVCSQVHLPFSGSWSPLSICHHPRMGPCRLLVLPYLIRLYSPCLPPFILAALRPPTPPAQLAEY